MAFVVVNKFLNFQRFLVISKKNKELLERFAKWAANIIVNGFLIALPICIFLGMNNLIGMTIAAGIARYVFFDFMKEYNNMQGE